MSMIKFAVGVELEGTYVKYALVSDKGEVLLQGKLDVEGEASRDDIIQMLGKAIQIAVNKSRERAVKVVGIGIGTPGIVCDGIVTGGAENLDGWQNINLAKIFSKKFDLPVFVDNDANVLGLGEVVYGAAQGCSDAIFITIGAGIGGAIVVNGNLYGGYKNRGTEMGHVPIMHNGNPCVCGSRGCLEAHASTTALFRQYAEMVGVDACEVDGVYLVERMKQADQKAIQSMDEHTDMLGHAIAGFINTFAPQRVVIGGGIPEAGQYYIEQIKNSAMRYAMPDCRVNTDVVGAALGNNAGCIGAASLVFRNLA
ncbi:ROK family protein [Mangrovibacterium diazotrophicum]|nr:ROK family protein [Mangrovibacterium diazotrophicum]